MIYRDVLFDWAMMGAGHGAESGAPLTLTQSLSEGTADSISHHWARKINSLLNSYYLILFRVDTI